VAGGRNPARAGARRGRLHHQAVRCAHARRAGESAARPELILIAPYTDRDLSAISLSQLSAQGRVVRDRRPIDRGDDVAGLETSLGGGRSIGAPVTSTPPFFARRSLRPPVRRGRGAVGCRAISRTVARPPREMRRAVAGWRKS